MDKKLVKDILTNVAKVFLIAIILIMMGGIYLLGLMQGYLEGTNQAGGRFLPIIQSLAERRIIDISPTITPEPTPLETQKPVNKPANQISWGGPQLWEVVNKRRSEFGVNNLSSASELCTIASIRLNELLELGKLDGHQGFSNMAERRPDLKWVFEKYSTIAEFLAYGGETPEETVGLWENTLGHRQLLTGGEYVWGCIYAQETFAVAITAF